MLVIYCQAVGRIVRQQTAFFSSKKDIRGTP